MRGVTKSPEVAHALLTGQAVVALESTILCHGFPPPERRPLAQALEAEVRAAGAVPATIAVVDGEVCVGLTEAQLERLLTAEDVAKCSARDVGVIAAQGRMGATTVAATCMIAASAGVEVFATGGIGGVHRGGELSLDVSADLAALRQFQVLVVSAGAKSLLDLPRTLEQLETHSVPVVGYGTDAFPSFHSVDSGLSVPHRLDDPAHVARAFAAQAAVGLSGGMLLCNPPPANVALPLEQVQKWLALAHDKAAAQGVAGAAVTPFVLSELAVLSEGQTVRTNRALALSNASVAAAVAVALAALRAQP